MKTVVVYKSLSGFTEKYAQWIAEDLNADIFSYKKASKELSAEKLRDYDVIIYGGSLHAVGISGADFIKSKLESLRDNTIIIFATGASPYREEVVTKVLNSNFSPEEQRLITFYYFRGGFDYTKLGFIDKLLMNLMKWKIRRKPEEERSPDEKGMLAAFDNPVDFTNKESIQEIIDHIRSAGD